MHIPAQCASELSLPLFYYDQDGFLPGSIKQTNTSIFGCWATCKLSQKMSYDKSFSLIFEENGSNSKTLSPPIFFVSSRFGGWEGKNDLHINQRWSDKALWVNLLLKWVKNSPKFDQEVALKIVSRRSKINQKKVENWSKSASNWPKNNQNLSKQPLKRANILSLKSLEKGQNGRFVPIVQVWLRNFPDKKCDNPLWWRLFFGISIIIIKPAWNDFLCMAVH